MRSWAMTVFFCAGVGLMPAQVAELAVSGGVSRFGKASLGSNVDQAGNTTNATVKDGFRLAVRFALNTYRFAGHEFGYAYNRSGVDLGDGVGARVRLARDDEGRLEDLPHDVLVREARVADANPSHSVRPGSLM